MDALTITKQLEATGIERKQAEKIAESITTAINEHHHKLSTKRDVYLLGVVMLTGFGYIVSILNTIITKLN